MNNEKTHIEEVSIIRFHLNAVFAMFTKMIGYNYSFNYSIFSNTKVNLASELHYSRLKSIILFLLVPSDEYSTGSWFHRFTYSLSCSPFDCYFNKKNNIPSTLDYKSSKNNNPALRLRGFCVSVAYIMLMYNVVFAKKLKSKRQKLRLSYFSK